MVQTEILPHLIYSYNIQLIIQLTASNFYLPTSPKKKNIICPCSYISEKLNRISNDNNKIQQKQKS